MLGGFVTEQEIFGDITTGPSDDLRKVTQMAREIIVRYGMSEVLGPQTFGESEELVFLGKEIHERRNYSEKTAERIDEEVSKMINSAKEVAHGIIKKERAQLEKIVAKLLEKETLEKEEFEALFVKV